jgi:hypothetical protein
LNNNHWKGYVVSTPPLALGTSACCRNVSRVYFFGSTITVCILKCDEEIMWELLLVVIVHLFFALKTRERFVLKYGNPFAGEDLLSFDPDAKGTRLFSTTPDTCPLDRPVLDAGLCYEECDEGYHGVGPVCWASTKDIGPGILAEFMTCLETIGEKDGGQYEDWGLLCHKPLKCVSFCDGDSRDAFGRCWAWDLRIECSGPDFKLKGLKCPGRINPAVAFNFLGDLVSDIFGDGAGDFFKTDVTKYKDLVDGMCYKKCPEEKPNHINGAPYLCTKGTRGLSYSRGAGTVPPLFHFGA